MPLPPSRTTFIGRIASGSDEPESVAGELLGHVGGLVAARVRGVLGLTGQDEVAQLSDAGIAREGKGSATHELRARVLGGVVRGRAGQPAVEVARADGEVELLGADLADVEHVGAGLAQAGRIRGGHVLGLEAHVAAEADGELARGPALAVGEDAREGVTDATRHVLVELARDGRRGRRRP